MDFILHKTSYTILTLNFADTYINIISAYYFMDFILHYLIVLNALMFAIRILMSQFDCSWTWLPITHLCLSSLLILKFR